ncbi:hypothetical protein DCAR_0417390 [Daucus carota subsp. sativus]|uniref:Uncharacterized protein n=1 Tax=Daucus carota subsp. sativus TaxID=79200 RepID=A0A162ACZ7_DAUCS|nr:hypothetical protein DCAR_0417390 [Daucus carota subsp. sativus]
MHNTTDLNSMLLISADSRWNLEYVSYNVALRTAIANTKRARRYVAPSAVEHRINTADRHIEYP